MQKIAIIDQIEITRSGFIQLRIAKETVVDGSTVHTEWHRTGFEPGLSVEDQMALANSHLETMGYRGISTDDIEHLSTIAAAAWQPEAIARWDEIRAERKREAEAEERRKLEEQHRAAEQRAADRAKAEADDKKRQKEFQQAVDAAVARALQAKAA